MEMIKCPECNKEISKSNTSCPMCGFKVRDFNEQSEKEYKKDVKRSMLIKLVIGIVSAIVIITAINIIAANQKMKSFQAEVDEFLVQWDGLIEESHQDSPNAIAVDLYNKNLVSAMQDISEMYVQFDDKTEVNEYLENHTWKEQYERVVRYNEEHEKREIEQEFIEFYTHMGE